MVTQDLRTANKAEKRPWLALMLQSLLLHATKPVGMQDRSYSSIDIAGNRLDLLLLTIIRMFRAYVRDDHAAKYEFFLLHLQLGSYTKPRRSWMLELVNQILGIGSMSWRQSQCATQPVRLRIALS